MHELPYSLMSELQKHAGKAPPPVHLWEPDNERELDLKVTRDGAWVHEGSVIKRPRLIQLFASVLRRDGDDYFLVTPVEKCRIQVEDVPFQIVLMDVTGEGRSQAISFTTDVADAVPLDATHPLRVDMRDDESVPYVMVRNGMEGRLARSVYYQLAALMVESQIDGEAWLGVWSHGQFFGLLAEGVSED